MRDPGSIPRGVFMWNQDSPVSVVSLHWWPWRDWSLWPQLRQPSSWTVIRPSCWQYDNPTWSHTALLSRFNSRCRSSFRLHNRHSQLHGGGGEFMLNRDSPVSIVSLQYLLKKCGSLQRPIAQTSFGIDRTWWIQNINQNKSLFMKQRPRWGWRMMKARGQKSHASDPLRVDIHNYDLICVLSGSILITFARNNVCFLACQCFICFCQGCIHSLANSYPLCFGSSLIQGLKIILSSFEWLSSYNSFNHYL